MNLMTDPYRKDVSKYNHIDIYRILDLYKVYDPAVGHAVKKLLCAGQRGAKDVRQDLIEAMSSIDRAISMMDEDEPPI